MFLKSRIHGHGKETPKTEVLDCKHHPPAAAKTQKRGQKEASPELRYQCGVVCLEYLIQ